MSTEKVAVVTGSNKGIGLAIVKGLLEKSYGIVYLTSRDATRGTEVINKLGKVKPVFHQLDVDDEKSVQEFHDYLKKTHGGIDLLVNNAAIMFNNHTKVPFALQAKETLKTNYFGTLSVCNKLLPLLRTNGRVVNVSSSCGHLSKIPSPELRAKLSNPQLTIDELSQLMKDFVKSAEDGKNVELGWGKSAYVVSKVGLSALTRIQQRKAEEEVPNRNLYINSVHPGYVDTDMTDHKGPLTVEEGARAPLFLALEPHGWKGEYVWRDSSKCDWLADDTPTFL